ncbi:hypothetical protein JXA32_04380 [Candidatus Sumerlaeota bacterium]|nr:hypothetical protein [Candidatus Sumerlaeota bacterium]
MFMKMLSSVLTITLLIGSHAFCVTQTIQIDAAANRYSGTFSADVAMAPTGEFVVVWCNGNPASGNIHGHRYDSTGNPIGNSFAISAVDYSYKPRIAMASSGEFIVVWHRIDYDNPLSDDVATIHARRYNAQATALGPEFRVDTNEPTVSLPSYLARFPDVSMNDDGAFVVVWSNCTGPGGHSIVDYHIHGRAYNSSGVAYGSEFRISNLAHTDMPCSTIDADGDFIVCWEHHGDANHLPYDSYLNTRHYNADGTPKNDPTQISPAIISPGATYFRIAMNEDGDYGVVWHRYDAEDIQCRQFASSGAASTSAFKLIGIAHHYYLSGFCMKADGRFIVSWLEMTDAGENVYAAWFNQNGDQRTMVTRISTPLNEAQASYGMAINENNQAVLIWEKAEADGYHLIGTLNPTFVNMPTSTLDWRRYQ